METLKLHRSLYNRHAVRDALDAFAEFGSYELSREGNYLVLTITDPDSDFADVLADEIANFALAGTIEHVRT